MLNCSWTGSQKHRRYSMKKSFVNFKIATGPRTLVYHAALVFSYFESAQFIWMQIEMRIYNKYGHQNIMLTLNQYHIPYVKKFYVRNLIKTTFRIYKSTCITVSLSLPHCVFINNTFHAESLSRSHCVFAIITCSVFFCGILVTTASVFVLYSRYFHAVDFDAESFSWSQRVFLL